MKFLVRYTGSYALKFEAGRHKTAPDEEATQFDSQEDAARAIAVAKLRPATVEIETIGKENAYGKP